MIISALRGPKTEQNPFIRLNKRNYIIVPFGVIANSLIYIVPIHLKFSSAIVALLFNIAIFAYCLIILYLLSKEKRETSSTNILRGAICMLVFNGFNLISVFNGGILLGFTGATYASLAYFSEIIFFSVAISYRTSADLKEKYEIKTEVMRKKLELEKEKKRASEILIKHDFELQAERTKAIIAQRTAIGRRLHNDLSGSLVTLRFLAEDFEAKATNIEERKKFRDLAAEISVIYKEARNYSHELSSNTTINDSTVSYNISSYLEKLRHQFLTLGLLELHIELNEDELLKKLDTAQTKNIYFLLKECISNTIKHAMAKNIWISIKFQDHVCNIQFNDDGKSGKDDIREGFGLAALRSSIADLGGNFEVTNTTKGMQINVSLGIE
ncbi:sensor histidine kinase [Pedobacter xixiisoli]|uniref:sensor histidine kinase n=1 Tax=Pedobacter xixiisoli TaxID=1476464 RepID=UPI00110C94E7|nr:hypothetical protein [Pedobacter xixiisoli]